MWKGFLYIHSDYRWMYVETEEEWNTLKRILNGIPDPNTPEDTYRASDLYTTLLSWSDATPEVHCPIFTYHCSDCYKGVRTLEQFFTENHMRW